MDVQAITQVLQTGMSGVLLVILFRLWGAFDEQNKFIRDQLLQSQAERKVIATAVGMTTQDLSAQAAVVRRQMQAAPNLHNEQPN